MNTPVALCLFNRPQLTRQVFAAVARARPPVLLVVADGPRSGRPEDASLCAQARAIVEAVDWPCRVERQYADANLGCRRRIATGLDWVFSQVDEAIVLEDDCLPDPTFFRFCEELLARYRDDERVHMVRGGNFFGDRPPVSSSYHFSRWYHIWGWATWARAWRHNDPTTARWPALRDSQWLESLLSDSAMVARARAILDDNHAGKVDTWEYDWVFSGWLRGALAACPARNLVTNIGFGPDAAHGRDAQHPHAGLTTAPMSFPLVHPDRVALDAVADRIEWERLNRPPAAGLLKRLRALLGAP